MRHDFMHVTRQQRGDFTAQQFHFADFTLDRSRYSLQRGERSLRLERLPMELLILLVDRRGELVSREEIAESLWGKDVFLDVDHSINVAVRKIRVALRDDFDNPRFVETVIGKGYRFAAAVTSDGGSSSQAEAPPIPLTAQPVSQPTLLPEPVVSKDTMHRRVVLAGAAVIVVLALAFVLNRVRRDAKGITQPPIRSIAVLPLRNLSGDPTQEYLADGMTEALIGRLAAIHDLRVISRTSVMRFKDTQLSVPEIARMLQVDAIVEGSVMREGNRMRVTAQLIRAAVDAHIWAGEYHREYRSILEVQEEVTRSIVEQIEVNLTPEDRQRLASTHPVDPNAYENYLKGRYYFNQRTQDALNKSIASFQEAIATDSAYAPAYSGLAEAYAMLGFRGGFPSKDALARAKVAALKAIELDSDLAEPHACLAFIAETYEWDWATAEREYKRALELSPGDARTHNWYAGFLTYLRRFDDAISEAKRARYLDPLSLPINNALAGRLLAAGHYDEALKQVQETLELDSHFAPAHQTMGWVYLHSGKQDEAIREFQTALELSGTEDTDLQLDLGFAYAVSGRRDQATSILTHLKQLHDQGVVPSGSVAIMYGVLGASNQAFAWLEKAYEERDPQLTYLLAGRRFEPLRKDPRFELLVRNVGLPD
jgi:TolB-like protein/DNA-binding winged helix-turn-helix (wHTH) protein/Tfp pilus assembly protein PilF